MKGGAPIRRLPSLPPPWHGRSRTGQQLDEFTNTERITNTGDGRYAGADRPDHEWSEVMTQQRPVHEPNTFPRPLEPIPSQPEPDEGEDDGSYPQPDDDRPVPL